MTKIYFKIIIILIATTLFISISYAQVNNPNKINRDFVKVINIELKSLQEDGLRAKTETERTIIFREVPLSEKAYRQEFKRSFGMTGRHKDDDFYEDDWIAFYVEWDDKFAYDIRKTDSIVSPYIGIVTFIGKRYVKIGTTKMACLSSPWKRVDKLSRLTLKYLYQDGKWMLKETPPDYMNIRQTGIE